MDEARFKVKSPSQEIYERVLGIARQSEALVLDNPRRLSLSVRNPSAELIDQLMRAGATVSREAQYDLDALPR